MVEITATNLVAKKLRGYFAEQGMTQKRIAEILGVQQQNVGQLLLGKRSFGHNVASKWSKAFGFSVHWLLTGNGKMFEPSSAPLNAAERSSDILIPVIPRKVVCTPNVDLFEFTLTSGESTYLPQISLFPEYELYFECASSAMAPEILPGDLLAIKRKQETYPFVNGETYVIDTKSSGMLVRMLEDMGDTVMATAHSERYKPTEFPKEDVISISTIVGLLRVRT